MRIHFISIGGAAMHNLALALHKNGHQVTGSDDAIYQPSKDRLEKAGLLPQSFGWFEENITPEIDAIILGMHAKADNPELIKAQRLGIKVYSYPEFIFNQSHDKTRVVIGGSHGKTTITAMVLHVLKYHHVETDFLVGAQIEGFDQMVHLSPNSEFIVLEGDEYLSSPIDLKPKFHWYRPTVALISGIAWDHINVFPTEECYIEQFKIFIQSITPGGILIYNEEDETLKHLVETTDMPIRKIPYKTPEYVIKNNISYLITEDGELPLDIFGQHNMSNLMGAKWICQQMGIDAVDFYEAISSFKGASKRLEKIKDTENLIIFKDFAHSPSKVRATLQSVKSQFTNKHITACLELHTFSSLNPIFIEQYKNTLNSADTAVVFFDREALLQKGNQALNESDIKKAFANEDIIVFTDSQDFQQFIYNRNWNNEVLLFMSSGNYGNVDFSLL